MYKDYNSFLNDKNRNNKSFFDKHIATRIDLSTGKNDCYIKFAKPDTRNGFMEFVYIGGYLTIQGDYGGGQFTWHNPSNTIETLADFAKNIGYFFEKQVSGDRCEIPYRWNSVWDCDTCIEIVEEYIKEYECEVPDEHWKRYTNDYIDWIDFLRNDGEKYFGYDNELYSAGCVSTIRPYLWCHGLIKAIEYLEKQDD